MSSRAEGLARLGWYVAFLGVIILLGEIVDSLSVLVALNFSALPLGSQHTPLGAAIGAWVVGLVLIGLSLREEGFFPKQ